MPSILLSYLTCFDRYLDADIENNIECILHGEFIKELFCGNHTKEPELDFPDKFNKEFQALPKKMLMSATRIIVLITSVFRLIVFQWGLCLLIMESTNRRGNSNYFLD